MIRKKDDETKKYKDIRDDKNAMKGFETKDISDLGKNKQFFLFIRNMEFTIYFWGCLMTCNIGTLWYT